MRHEVDLPAEIDQRLSAKASESGQEVGHLILMAIVRFVDADAGTAGDGHWCEETEQRRRELIDKDIAGTMTPSALIATCV